MVLLPQIKNIRHLKATKVAKENLFYYHHPNSGVNSKICHNTIRQSETSMIVLSTEKNGSHWGCQPHHPGSQSHQIHPLMQGTYTLYLVHTAFNLT